MPERIYTQAADGSLEALEETRFSTEDELQALSAEHPELLDGEQIRPGDARRWILITREKGIAASSGEGARWAVDHLIVDQDAVPTLAEVKRGSNPEIRRSIVGQMLEVCGARVGDLDGGRVAQRVRGANPCSRRRSRRRPRRFVAKEMKSPMWMASGKMYPRTLRPNVFDCCSWRTKYRIPSHGWSRSSTRRCPASRCWRLRSSGSTARSAQTLVPRVIGRTAAGSARGQPSRPRLLRGGPPHPPRHPRDHRAPRRPQALPRPLGPACRRAAAAPELVSNARM